MSNHTVSIAEEALGYPGAILFRGDTGDFRDADNIGYEIAIQHPRLHKRFANVFCYRGHTMLYFKHDPSSISRLYEDPRGHVLPSEIAGKYWSKVNVLPETATLASELLRRSYYLVLASLTKEGQRIIRSLEGQTNRFLVFHGAGLALAQREGVYLDYRDYLEPGVHVGIVPVALFRFNTLVLRRPKQKERCLSADRYLEWPQAMTQAVASGA